MIKLIFSIFCIILMPYFLYLENKKPKNRYNKITLYEIFIFAKSINESEKKTKITNQEKGDKFDFNKMQILMKNVTGNYTLYYDKDNNLVQLLCQNKEKLDEKYRIKFYHSGEFIIYDYTIIEKNEEYFMPGFFVYLKDEKRNYFISTIPHFGRFSTTTKFVDVFPIKSFYDISAITFLDENLTPLKTLKISKNRIIMGSQMIYSKKNSEILYEFIYMFNVPELVSDNKLNIGYDFCIVDTDNFFHEYFINPMFCRRFSSDNKMKKIPTLFWELFPARLRWNDCNE